MLAFRIDPLGFNARLNTLLGKMMNDRMAESKAEFMRWLDDQEFVLLNGESRRAERPTFH